MPRVHLILRFDSSSDKKPLLETSDITTNGDPACSKTENPYGTTTYTIIDDKTDDTYRVTIEVPRKDNDNVHVSYGSTSREDVLPRLTKIPGYMRESDIKRTEHQGDNVDKAVISWWGDSCIRIKLRKDSFMWYEVVAIDVEAEDDGEEKPEVKKQKKKVSFG
jgi:hypothetical protein